MPLRVYRVCRAAYARLDGRGAWLAGGRWNSPGRGVVYMAQNVALAVVENLVHMPRQDFPTGYVTVSAEIPDDIESFSESIVRSSSGLSAATPQAVGDWWFDRRVSAVLQVHSAVVPAESNFLLNPAHPDFRRIVVATPAPFQFDPRLFGG